MNTKVHPSIVGIQREMMLTKLAVDLVRIHNDFIKKVDDLQNNIAKQKGPKGDKPSAAEIASMIEALMPHSLKQEMRLAIKELLPAVKDGYSPTADDIKAVAEPIIKALIPKNKPQVSYKPLSAAQTFELIRPFLPKNIDSEVLCLEILSKIDGEKIINYIDQLPKGKRFKIEHIDNLEATMRGFAERYAKGDGKKYLHGGGDTVVAGTNITITTNANGTKTISASGGIGAPVSPTSGTVDGTTTVFTFATKPTLLVSDNGTYRENFGWTWNSGTSQATLSVAPTFDLFAL